MRANAVLCLNTCNCKTKTAWTDLLVMCWFTKHWKGNKVENYSRSWGIYEKRYFGCGKENSADILYRKVLQYVQLTSSTKQSYCIRNFTKWCKVSNCISKKSLKSMFSCWVVKTNPVAVKYLKRYNVNEREIYGLQYGGYVILQLYKKIILIAKSTTVQFIFSNKLQKYSWMWKSKDKFSICDLLNSFYRKY